jgi:hypothetical protein
MHAEVDAVLDELHGQVTKDTEVSLLFCDGLGSCITTVCMMEWIGWLQILGKNFSKIYDSAESLLKENREKVCRPCDVEIDEIILLM